MRLASAPSFSFRPETVRYRETARRPAQRKIAGGAWQRANYTMARFLTERLRYLVWLLVLFESLAVVGRGQQATDGSVKLSWFIPAAESARIGLGEDGE